MKKPLSKLYLVLLSALIAFQYTPLLSQVRAEGQQRVSPSPGSSQMPEANAVSSEKGQGAEEGSSL